MLSGPMDISFSERLVNVMALQNLLSTHGADGRLEAKQLEESAYQKADAKVQYQYSTSSYRRHNLTSPLGRISGAL